MAPSIRASVGRLATNNPDDVVTVQRLLNRVPHGEGGPYEKLDDDGLAGSKTNKAIQVFQLHHFGWSGADGRIQPNRQTWHRLKQYAPAPEVPPPPVQPPPPPKPPRTKNKTLNFTLIQPGHPNNMMDEEHEFFFRLTMQDQSHQPKIYWLGPKDGYKRVTKKAKFTKENWINGSKFSIHAPARAIDELECEANYVMTGSPKYIDGDAYFGDLWLNLGPHGRAAVVPMRRPLAFRNPQGRVDGHDVFARRGWFQLVENSWLYVEDEIWSDLPTINW